MTSTAPPLCQWCLFRDITATGPANCLVFGVPPRAILDSSADHRKPYPGDNGVVFVNADDDDPAPPWLLSLLDKEASPEPPNEPPAHIDLPTRTDPR